MPFEDLPDEEVGSRQLDDDTLASYQKQFNYSAEELDSVPARARRKWPRSSRFDGR
ncbi:hypothetical protein MJ699_27305 [Klebsiella pneumoniae]|nr:hypothetical protein MJ699_27305 [Klebsiella pneumoniae]